MDVKKIRKAARQWCRSITPYQAGVRLLVTTVLLSLAFTKTSLAWLIMFALVPSLGLVYTIKPTSKVIRSIWIPGLLFSGVSMAWVLQTIPTKWTVTTSALARFSVIYSWTLSSLTISVGFLLLGMFVSRYRDQPKKIIVALPFVWALSEIFRSYTFAIASYGPGGHISPNFNFGSLGLALASTPFAYASRFVGLYGLTVLAVLINISIYVLLTKKYRYACILIAVPVLLSVAGYTLYRSSNDQIKAGVVHLGRDDFLRKWEIEKPNKDTDLLVMPEYSEFFKNPDYDRLLKNHAPNALVITSIETGGKGDKRNTLKFYSHAKGTIDQQDKTYLIPSGEYIPYVMTASLKLFKMQDVLDNFNQTQRIIKGNTPEKVVSANNITVGAIACSGVTNYSEYARLSRNGAQVLTSSASLSFLQNASLYHVQEKYFTRFHAIANQKPFIQSARSDESYVLNSNGNELIKTSGNSKLMTIDIASNTHKTPYSYVDLWVVTSLLLLAIVFILKRF
ncbi:MAG: hypothetical protein WCO19_01445 [Candidatus Saccharibacteria bacterium]